MAQVSTQAARSVVHALYQAFGFVPFFVLRGVLFDHRKGYLEARRLGLPIKRLEVDAVTAARLLFGPHPDRAVELLQRESGWDVLRCLREIGAHRPVEMAAKMARTLAAHQVARRRLTSSRRRWEGDPEHGAEWPSSSHDDPSTNS